MTMFASPSVTTSASATPRPLTRCSMIWRASSRSSGAGALPSGVRAVSVTVVPPRTSRPSWGVRSEPVKKMRPYITARIRTSAPKWGGGGGARLATGPPSEGLAGGAVAGPVLRGGVDGRVDHGLAGHHRAGHLAGHRAHLDDRPPRVGDDDARRDLDLDRGRVVEAGYRAVHATGHGH